VAVPNALHVRVLRTDGAGEFVSDVFMLHARNSGIVIQRSAPHIHQHNGVAERFNRTLISRVRSVLIDTGLPLLLWDEISSTVNYSDNDISDTESDDSGHSVASNYNNRSAQPSAITVRTTK
jgi:hypothetical protein